MDTSLGLDPDELKIYSNVDVGWMDRNVEYCMHYELDAGWIS